MKRIEQTIHRLTTSPALTEAQRIELLGLLAGTRNGRIDPKHVPNTPAEQRLVDNFRAMSTNHRRLASLLFAALGKERRA
jgi:hypothetical protein